MGLHFFDWIVTTKYFSAQQQLFHQIANRFNPFFFGYALPHHQGISVVKTKWR